MSPLSVIIVTHEHAAFIGAALKALVPEAREVGAEVFVVDNLSTDKSAEIAATVEGVKVIAPSKRQGFSANCNLGMARASGELLLLLNPDTEVRPGALGALIDFMASHPRAGMVGARLLNPDGTPQPSARRFPTISSVVARRTPLRVLMRESEANRRHLMLDMLDVTLTRPTRVDWLLGACMCVRRATVEDVGPLDEGYFLYVEDIDWAKRMHDAGWEVWFAPGAEIVHHHLAESDHRLLGRRSLIHTQSMARYVRKHLLGAIPWMGVRGEELDVWAREKAAHPHLWPRG